jgi:hypothetical protein
MSFTTSQLLNIQYVSLINPAAQTGFTVARDSLSEHVVAAGAANNAYLISIK